MAIQKMQFLVDCGRTMTWQDKALKLIDASGKTQEQIAEELEVAPGTLSRYLNGHRAANDLDVIRRIAKALNVSWLSLLAENELDEMIFNQLDKLTPTEKQQLLQVFSLGSQLLKKSC